MQLDELQSVRDRERQTDKLQQLRESFYVEAGEFIQQLRAERDRAAERADDPFDAPEVNRLTDEINTAEQTVEAIYEKRVGKIVKAASFAAADLPAEADGMTQEEQELFETLVSDIKQNRQRVLDVLAGEAPEVADTGGSPTVDTGAPTNADAGSPPVGDESDPSAADAGRSPADPQKSPPAETDSGSDGVAAADLMGGDETPVPPEQGTPAGAEASDGSDSARPAESGPEPPEPEGEKLRNDGGDIAAGQAGGAGAVPGDQSAADRGDAVEETGGPTIERTTVRVTDDVDTFVGSDDRDYDLQRDDVVTLPAANAEILIDRDAAEQL